MRRTVMEKQQMLEEAPSEGGDDPEDSASEGEEEKFEDVRIRLVEPVMIPFEVRTTKSICEFFCGEDSAAEGVFFYFGAKNQKAIMLLWCMWLLGAVLGLLSLTYVLPDAFIWTSALMLPMPLTVFLLLSVDIASPISGELEYKVITVLQSFYIAAGCGEMGFDERCFFWACFAVSLYVSSYIDAYPAKYRRQFSLLFFAGTASMMISWDAILFFGLCSNCSNAPLRVLKLTFAPEGFTITSSGTLLVFCYRFIKTAAFSPEKLVLLKSTLRTHVTVFRSRVSENKVHKVLSSRKTTQKPLVNFSDGTQAFEDDFGPSLSKSLSSSRVIESHHKITMCL